MKAIFPKIAIISVLGFCAGLGIMAFRDGYFERVPENRAEAMVWLFEKYCAPLHKGLRPAFSKRMIDLGQHSLNAAKAEPNSFLVIRRGRRNCSVSDEIRALDSSERSALASIFEHSIGENFPEFEVDTSHGLGAWDQYLLWSNGERDSSIRAGAYLARASATGDASQTFISLGTPYAPEVSYGIDGW